MNNELKKYLNGEAMDEKCNCGVDHGSAEKNIAPSVVEGDEKSAVSVAEDAAAKYLAQCADDGEGVRKHADGSVCKAQSPETCPFNKSAEAGEKAITGEEKADSLYERLERLAGNEFEKEVISEIDEIEVPSPSRDPQNDKTYYAKDVISEEDVWEKAQEIFEKQNGNMSRDELLKQTAEAVEEAFVDKEYREWLRIYWS